MTSPIIIGCAPSSGSTLLRTLLGRHPSIASGGEVALLDKRRLLMETPESYRASIASWLDAGYPAEFLGPSEELFQELDEYPWDRNSLRDMCLAMPDYPSMLEAFYARAMQVRGARRWLDKCPSNIYCFDLIAKLYPSARFIQIVRDARDTVVSYCRRGASAFRSVSRWYYATLCGLQYTGAPSYLRITYESLVRDPALVLRRVCDFLDEPYLDRLLIAGHANGQPRHPGWRHSATAPVDPGSIHQFRHELTGRQRSMFNHLALSESAAKSLQQAGLPAIPSPIELQEMLGYSTGGLTGSPALTPTEFAASRMEIESYQSRILHRYGVRIESPVQLLELPRPSR